MWTHHVAALSAHYRVYALDIIGDVGFSVNRREISKPDDFVNWLDEVFRVLVPEGQLSLDDKAWQSFDVPCLFLVGENEKIYSAQAAVRRLHRVAPQVGAEIIPNAGHDLTMVQADLVVRKVLEFLGEPAQVAASAGAASKST
jgi:hypothetical protein